MLLITENNLLKFRYATYRDKWFIGIGTVFAVLHGAGFPLLALIFGNMTDTFIRQSLYVRKVLPTRVIRSNFIMLRLILH